MVLQYKHSKAGTPSTSNSFTVRGSWHNATQTAAKSNHLTGQTCHLIVSTDCHCMLQKGIYMDKDTAVPWWLWHLARLYVGANTLESFVVYTHALHQIVFTFIGQCMTLSRIYRTRVVKCDQAGIGFYLFYQSIYSYLEDAHTLPDVLLCIIAE